MSNVVPSTSQDSGPIVPPSPPQPPTVKDRLLAVSAIVAAIAVLVTNADRAYEWTVDNEGRRLVAQIQASIATFEAEVDHVNGQDADDIKARISAVRDWKSELNGQDRVKAALETISLLKGTYKQYIPGDSQRKLDDAMDVLESAQKKQGLVTTAKFQSVFERDYEQLVDAEVKEWDTLVVESKSAIEQARAFVNRKATFDDFQMAESKAAGPLTRRRADSANPPLLYKAMCHDLYSFVRSLENHRKSRWWWSR